MKTTLLSALMVLLGSTLVCTAQVFPNYSVEVSNMGSAVNSPGNDYAPFIAGDDNTLYITSYRSENSRGRADLFVTRRGDSLWSSAANADLAFNTDHNEGALSIAADGKTIVFASQRDDGFGDADIYIGELVEGRIIDVRNLGQAVNTKYWESQPSITGDGRTIFFASNRPGGIGRTDIWRTQRDAQGNWGTPMNLGAVVNTPSDERSPFVTPDGATLYFSTNGRVGYGGYDIYMTAWMDSAWREPANLGATVNSDGDELFFCAPFTSQRFFVASNRNGGAGGLDIYAGTPNIFGQGVFRLMVSVRDTTTGGPAPATISIIDSATGTTVAIITTNTQVAEYPQILPAGRSYRIVAQAKGNSSLVIEIGSRQSHGTRPAAFSIGEVPIAIFDLGRYNVPFFVTGYYRPNTKGNLDDLLRSVQQGPLSEAGYIEQFKQGSKRYDEYVTYSQVVESVFKTIYMTGVEEIFRDFSRENNPADVLEIVVTGYADPQSFVGTYLEEQETTFSDLQGNLHTVRKGDPIGNLELSGLRAHYSGEYLDQLFTNGAADGFQEYGQLKSEGRIHYKYVGAEVSGGTENYAMQRRVQITMIRRSPLPPRQIGDISQRERSEATTR